MTAINEISLQSVKELLKDKSTKNNYSQPHSESVKTKLTLSKAVTLNRQMSFPVELILHLSGRLHRVTTPIYSVSDHSVLLGKDTQIPMGIIVSIDFP